MMISDFDLVISRRTRIHHSWCRYCSKTSELILDIFGMPDAAALCKYRLLSQINDTRILNKIFYNPFV